LARSGVYDSSYRDEVVGTYAFSCAASIL
jgi:hypothetical protein